jgi:hypothetical protein
LFNRSHQLRTLYSLTLGVMLAGCGAPASAPNQVAEAWRTTYTKVTACTPTAHPRGGFIEVWSSPDPLLDGNLRAGAVLLKVQWDTDPTCTPDAQDIYTVMTKLSAGSAPQLGDWRWELANGEGRISVADEATCAGCHYGCPDLLCTAL